MARTVDPVRHRQRRAHILGTAAELFATRGFQGTTTAELCRAAGISTGSLFHYFPNKRAVFVALLQHPEDGTAAAAAAALGADDPVDGLLDFVAHLAAPVGEPHVPGLVLEAMLQAARDPDLLALLEDDSAQEEAVVARLLSSARAAGAIDPDLDPEQTASWIMALVGALFLGAATGREPDPQRLVPTLVLTVERLLRLPA